MPVSSCSAPIGSSTATQRSESCAWSAARVRKKSARSRSSMFAKTTRESPSASARLHTRVVVTSTPMTAETTTRAPSTTRRLAIVSAWKPESPGVSTRLIFRPCHSRCASDEASDICRRCSSSSQSPTVVPASTAPRRFVLPAWKSIASRSDVFPVPRWPTTATLRIFAGSYGMPQLLLGRGFGLPSILEAGSRRMPGQALGSGARHGPGDAGLQAQDRLRVELGDARLRHPEHLPDLAQRQLLVVVERDHELLALGQPRDRVAEDLAQLGLIEHVRRADALGVLDRVEERDLVALVRDRPELVERGDRGAGDVGERVLELVDGDPDPDGDLLVGRGAAELRLEGGDRALDLAGARADRARHPVEGPQLVDDRAADPRDRVRLELDVAVGVVALDRADQAEEAVRDEVALVDVRRQARPEPARDVLHERRVHHDQLVAQLLRARPAVLEPEAPRVDGLDHCGKRIRASGAFSSARTRRGRPSRPRSPPRP